MKKIISIAVLSAISFSPLAYAGETVLVHNAVQTFSVKYDGDSKESTASTFNAWLNQYRQQIRDGSDKLNIVISPTRNMIKYSDENKNPYIYPANPYQNYKGMADFYVTMEGHKSATAAGEYAFHVKVLPGKQVNDWIAYFNHKYAAMPSYREASDYFSRIKGFNGGPFWPQGGVFLGSPKYSIAAACYDIENMIHMHKNVYCWSAITKS